jgi:fibronectin type 3 domain-containing protein
MLYAGDSAEAGTEQKIIAVTDDNYELKEITVKTASGKTLDLTDEGSGNYSFTMPEEEVTISATVVNTAAKATTVTAKKSGKTVALSWKKVTGATGYIVYRSTSKNGTYTKVGTTTSLKYTDKKGLKKGKTYYYKVRAYVKVGDQNVGFTKISSPKMIKFK